MYEYPFKNDPALSAAINDLGAWRFACLLTKKPDKRTILDEVKHGDLVRIRYALYDMVSTLLGEHLSPEVLHKAILTTAKEVSGKSSQPNAVTRAVAWIAYSIIVLDFGGDNSARQIKSGAIDWELPWKALREFLGKQPENLADRMVHTLCQRRLSGRFKELIELSIGRVALKEFRRDIGWKCPVGIDALEHVVDWLVSAEIEDADWLNNVDDLGRPKKLMKFGSIEAICKEADKQMLRKLTGSQSGTLGVQDVEPFADDGGDCYLVRLKTPAALKIESYKMRHCVGHGAYDAHLERDEYLLLSLRDRQGQPHMTIELDGGIALQARGKANSVPKDRYINEARRLLAKRGLRSLDDTLAASIFDDEFQAAA